MKMSTKVRHAVVAPLAAVALGAVAFGPAPALAADDPVGDAVGSVQQKVEGGSSSEPAPSSQPAPTSEPAQESTTATVPSSPAPPPSSDDDSAGHETEDPGTPDHGAAQVADVDLADEDVADVASSDATIEDNDSTSGDATLLALGGEEIIGAHATSDGTNEDHAGDPLAPLCEGSEGGVCLRILYADAYATEDGETSRSSSQSGVLDACIGGSSADPEAECDGPVSAGAGQSEGEAERNQGSGQTTASSSSSTADANVADGAVTAGVLQSEGEADSGNSPGSASRESTVADLAVQDTPVQAEVSDPFAIAVPPDCTSPSIVCVFGNQGETYVGDGIAGHAQEALHVEALDGTLVTELSRSETLVHNDGGEAGPSNPGPGNPGPGNPGPGNPGPGSPGPGSPGPDAGVDGGPSADVAAQAGDAADEGVLPNTGGPAGWMAALALAMVSGGALLLARRRGEGVLA